MKKRMSKMAAFAGCVLLAAQAVAVPLYDNGPASDRNGFAINGSVLGKAGTAADDFRLGTAAKIGSIGFYFNNYKGTTGWDQAISYAILASNDGGPGTLLATGRGVNVTQLAGAYPWCCGAGAGTETRLVEFELETPFAASANTSYWLRLGGAGGPSPWWVTSGPGNAISYGNGTDFDLAFYLNAVEEAPVEVPEPAGRALLGLGFALLLLRRRSR